MREQHIDKGGITGRASNRNRTTGDASVRELGMVKVKVAYPQVAAPLGYSTAPVGAGNGLRERQRQGLVNRNVTCHALPGVPQRELEHVTWRGAELTMN